MHQLPFSQHFYSVFESKNQEPHSKCPLHLSYDLYRIQEGNKTQEYAAKWVCNFCGKAFFSEHYLDLHFDNKHSDKLVKVRELNLKNRVLAIIMLGGLRWTSILSKGVV